MNKNINKLINNYFKKKIIILNFKKYFKYSSGFMSPIYIDNRLIYSFPKLRSFIVDCMAMKISNTYEKIDCICAVPNSGIPLGSLIAEKLGLPFIYLRKNQKKYGVKEKIFEGNTNKTSRILLIEDVFTTGKSAYEAYKILKENNYNPIGAFAIYSYNLNNFLVNNDILNSFIFSFQDIVTYINKEKNYNESEIKELVSWYNDFKKQHEK